MAALDDRVAVAIQATRKLSVEIMMIIDVPDFGAITALHGKRESRMERVFSPGRNACALDQSALPIRLRVALPQCCERSID